MALTSVKNVPRAARTSLIRISYYDQDKNVHGVIENCACPGGKEFFSLTQMLFGIEEILDGLSFPQNEMEIRKFDMRRFEKKNDRPSDDQTESLANFQVQVIFRQNASWQGILTWVEKQSEASFRSVFELISLLDGALSQTCTSNA